MITAVPEQEARVQREIRRKESGRTLRHQYPNFQFRNRKLRKGENVWPSRFTEKISVRAETRSQDEKYRTKRCEDFATIPGEGAQNPKLYLLLLLLGTKQDFKGNPAPRCFPLLSLFSIPSLLLQLVVACLQEGRSGCRGRTR